MSQENLSENPVLEKESRVETAVFGSFDGLISAIGVIVALGAMNQNALLVAIAGLAVASGVGMAAGEWLSSTKCSIANALVMGIATIAGTIAPAIPFFIFPIVIATLVSVVIAIGLGVAIAKYRSPDRGNRAYVETMSILAMAVGLTAIVSQITGAA